MSKVLLINPNKWGRGITAIWIASHSAALKSAGHEVSLFDSTFYADWTVDETSYNTNNEQYRQTDYSNFINYSSISVREALQKKINEFNPDIIFWSAISSHIHGEGEYVNIQYGYDLVSSTSHNALLVTGGLQATANAKSMLNIMKDADFLIRGESELVLTELASRFSDKKNTIHEIKGLSFINEEGNYVENQPQEIISNMDELGPYDYSLFEIIS